MLRTSSLALAALAAVAAWPAMAQERGGLPLQAALHGPAATLGAIQSNRGCPLSTTTVSVGVNRAFGTGDTALQQLGTVSPASPKGCHPLVATQIAAGVNLGLGRNSFAGQSINVQGQRGALATNLFTRGVNAGVGAGSIASQRILNQVGH